MNRRSVSFVAPSAYTLGGVATWLDQLVPALRAMGWQASVVLTQGEHHDAARYEQAHPAVAPAVRVRSATGTRESRVQALARVLGQAPPALVVSVNIPDALLAAAHLKADGSKMAPRAVMSVHGLEPDLFLDLELLAPVLDGVVCSNRLACARALAPGLLDPARVRYAPYGTPVDGAMPRAEPAGVPFTVGFAGRFERFQKRVHDLAPIARALLARGVDARWLVAGEGPDSADVDALSAVVPGAVERLGHVDAVQMPARFFSRCNALLMTSEWETGPIVVWEAMARDVAVVSSRYVGSGRESALVHQENCLLFPVGDADAAAACLQQAASAALREQLAERARALVAGRYSLQASARAWADALGQLAGMDPCTGAPPPSPVQGRLDRLLGARGAERVRRLAGRRSSFTEPGGEWPHAYSAGRRDDPAHWAALRELDAPGEAAR